ncbi:helix-hairpin-helix domain-containing protein [Desulforudis sp. 1031]|uniref:helix-hairpin-helix domain-containing protein n=2 Tax=Candidatus Desulforudis TaxID=471826 RepID=UPI003CF06705
MEAKTALANLRQIPGVGKSMARDLYDLGFRAVEELRGRDPEEMYRRLCKLRGQKIDRCVLYLFRCAVYYAHTINIFPSFSNGGTGRTKERGADANESALRFFTLARCLFWNGCRGAGAVRAQCQVR